VGVRSPDVLPAIYFLSLTFLVTAVLPG
jgi:hypothetical protein